MIPGLPHGVVIMHIIPHLSLSDYNVCVSKTWHESRFDVYKSITDLGLIDEFSNTQFNKISKYLINAHYVVYGKWVHQSDINYLDANPQIRSICVSNDHYYESYRAIFTMKHASNITRLSLSNASSEDLSTIVSIFPNIDTLILESAECSSTAIECLSGLKYLKNLRMDGEFHNMTWDFSHLSLDYFSFWDFYIEMNGLCAVYVDENNTIKLPHAKRMRLDTAYNNSLCDQIIDINPDKVVLILERDDGQLYQFKERLDSAGISIVICKECL